MIGLRTSGARSRWTTLDDASVRRTHACRLHGAAEGRNKGGQDVGGVQIRAAPTGCRRVLQGVARRLSTVDSRDRAEMSRPARAHPLVRQKLIGLRPVGQPSLEGWQTLRPWSGNPAVPTSQRRI